MASANRIVRRYYERKANADSQALPTPSTRREVSATEANAPYVPATHRQMFCFHEIPLFRPCTKCNRDKRQGELALIRLCRNFGIAVQ
jgi:hypothetical protein